MRRFLAIIGVVCLWATAGAAQEEATPTGARRKAATEEEAREVEEDVTVEVEPAEEAPPRLRAPALEGLELPAEEPRAAEEYGPDKYESEDEMAAEDAALLGMAEPPPSDPTLASWTNPRPVFTLNGYFRVRGTMNNNFNLGRQPLDRLTGEPFGRWIGLGQPNQ